MLTKFVIACMMNTYINQLNKFCWQTTFFVADDMFADLGSSKPKKSKKLNLDDDDLFGDPLGGLKWKQLC